MTKDIYREKNLTVFKITGIVLFNDLRQAIIDYYESGATDFLILDFREAREAESQKETFSYERITELTTFIEGIRKGREKGKTALVVTKDVFYGICRTFEAYMTHMIRSKIKYRIFRTMDEAVKWIENRRS